MFFNDLMEEVATLDFQDDAMLLEWLHRLFLRTEELEVSELPNRKAIADKICSERGIAYDINPIFPSPESAPGDPVFAAWLLEETVFTLRQNPDKPSPLYKYYGTIRVFIEIYLEIKPE